MNMTNSRPNRVQTDRHRSKIRIAVGLWILIVIACCVTEHEPEWTPYLPPGPPDVVAEGQTYSLYSMPAEVRLRANSGCIECHEGVTDPHPSLEIGCVYCHGGNGTATDVELAHPRPDFPDEWPSSANPQRPYTLTLRESREWIRFVNPGDLRVANETCGKCHPKVVLNVSKSLMTNSAHFWGVAGYANGIVSGKRSIFGESYSPEGIPQRVNNVIEEDGVLKEPTPEETEKHGYSPFLVPRPHWEVTQPGNIYRVFERGSRLGGAALGLNGAPVPIVGIPDKLEEPGRPNNRLSDRGLGTLNRVDLPILNLLKTRLNDPHLSFFGTNDQPGDYRSSGCTACHMVYANDRDPVHSGPWAQYGNRGLGNVGGAPWSKSPWPKPVTEDPEIPGNEPGHPLLHKFTRAIPSSQCMVCHMHQPNAFLNSYYGFQMWTYETDGAAMWPEEQQYPSSAEWFERIERNPEEAAVRGKWGDPAILPDITDLNPTLQHTQFADYHGHGWIFRGVFKMDRKGNLLDRDGEVIPYDDPDKFQGVIPTLGQTPSDLGSFEPQPGRAVHLKDIHAEKGMHCVDCHFEQDVHGNGKLYAEYQAAIQITCQDCHGTIDSYASLAPSGPAAPDNGTFELDTTPWRSRARFVRSEGKILQRSMLYPDLEWEVSQVRDSVDPENRDYNAKAARAKLETSSHGGLAHTPEKMDCASCHTSWVTSCFGCHLPQQANWRSPVLHFEGKELRNLASYNPQVARDDAFMLGISGDVKGNRIGVVRSSSAVMISSQDAQRRTIYKQLPTVAANGMSGQAFNTHFPHTVRKTETRACSDCHVSSTNDNNAWLAQTYLLGTNYVNFVGMHAYVGEGSSGFEAVVVTEWGEPQAVLGSNLHRMAYPDDYRDHLQRERRLTEAVHHGGTDIQSLVLRGEYLYTASGEDGFRVYDVANVANKDFSEKTVTSPVSPLGQDTHVPTRYATAVALPINNLTSMGREYRVDNRETPYQYDGSAQNLHESYRYAYITDRHEGLILVDVDCLTDGDPENNFLQRALTFNPGGVLNGAVNLAVAGTTVYVCCDQGIVTIDIEDPLKPRVIAQIGAPEIQSPTSIAVQFRYAFVTDENGVQVLDITSPERMSAVPGARVDLQDARDIYLAREYAYVAAGPQGLVILNIQEPEAPSLDQVYDAQGTIGDLNQVVCGMTNDSFYAYLADGDNGLHVLSLVTPEDGGRSAYGFSPRPMPKLIANYRTSGPAMAIAKGLDRDRAVDESGNQVAVFGRIGGRPFNLEEMRRLYVRGSEIYQVEDAPAAGSTNGTSSRTIRR